MKHDLTSYQITPAIVKTIRVPKLPAPKKKAMKAQISMFDSIFVFNLLSLPRLWPQNRISPAYVGREEGGKVKAVVGHPKALKGTPRPL